MYQVKLLLGTASVCALIIALMMIWNEKRLSLTFFEMKSLETVFVIAAIMLAKDCAKLKKQQLWTDILKNFKKKYSMKKRLNMIMMMWRMNI